MSIYSDMSRLTEKDPIGNVEIIGVDDELLQERVLMYHDLITIQRALCKLADFEDAEENGTLICLPCKPGDTVFGIRRFYKRSKVVNEEVATLTVDHFTIGDNETPIMTVCDQANEWYDYEISDIGVGVFFTLDEAKKALKTGSEGGGNDNK